MNIREIIGSLCSALLFLLTAAIIDRHQLWSNAGNYTVPWFCCTITIALLIVTLTSILTGCSPCCIPLSCVLIVIIGSSVAVGLGMLVDWISYEFPIEEWMANISEWAGFTIILVVLFWLPRIRAKTIGTQGSSDT